MWLYFLKLYNPILNSYSLHFTVPLPPTGRDHIAPSNQTHIFPRAREGCRLLLFRLETNPQESLRSKEAIPHITGPQKCGPLSSCDSIYGNSKATSAALN